ncbi:MAG: AsmA family protein [Chthoniobacterales bacterium]|nr:AsmA family protein [Chthoniobacterales bacterium]
MKKAGRIALCFAGGIVALLAIALLAVNLYVQSHVTQARIQQELTQRLGTTLRIQRISVTPWWGLKLTGITMPQSETAVTEDFLKADTFRLRIRLASLFSGHLVIKEVSLVKPRVVWAQNSDGKWRLPTLQADRDPAEAAPELPPPVLDETQHSAAPADDTETAGATQSSFTPEVRRVTLAHGDFRFLDVRGNPVAEFEDVGFRSSLRNSTELRGDASIARISLRNRFFLEALKSPITYDPEQLHFSQITARAGDGEIAGRFSMRPADPDSPFEVKVTFRDVQADRIVADAGGPVGMVHGRIEGRLDANGKTADPNALEGAGEIFLREGEVRQYSVLVALGQLLQIEELKTLQLEQAQVKYHITPGLVTVDELLLTSPNIRLSAAGTISFKGKLQLASQLAISEKIRGQLFSGIRSSFVPISQPGYTAVDFNVTGTVDRPKTNLMGKLVGPQLKDLGSVIDGLLGRRKPERPKKNKRAEEPAPSPAEMPTESPPEDVPAETAPADVPPDPPEASATP